MSIHAIFVVLILSAVLLGCTTVPERQSKFVSAYLEAHPDSQSDIKEALLNGKVIIGMTEEEAFLASGIKVNNFRNYSIWIVGKNDELMLPPIVIPPDRQEAITTKNRTQFESNDVQGFAVYFDGNYRVTKVKRWDNN